MLSLLYYHNIFILEDTSNCTLRDVLIFAAGADDTPPLGFDPPPQLDFTQQSKFPLGNTCANILVLSLCHEDFESFKKFMKTGLLNAPAFGLP